MQSNDIRDPSFNWNNRHRGRLGLVGAEGCSNGKKGRIGLTLPPNGFVKDMEACGIAGLINIDGTLETGRRVVDMITTMQDRENGLGAGYACYGLFSELKDQYCIQLLLDTMDVKEQVSEYFKTRADIVKDEKVFTQPVSGMKGPYPLIWRFFLDVPKQRLETSPHLRSLSSIS